MIIKKLGKILEQFVGSTFQKYNAELESVFSINQFMDSQVEGVIQCQSLDVCCLWEKRFANLLILANTDAINCRHNQNSSGHERFVRCMPGIFVTCRITETLVWSLPFISCWLMLFNIKLKLNFTIDKEA